MYKKKKAALVLSGGAARGAIQLGIISILEREYEFEFFAGTSIGSLIIGFLAMGWTAEKILEMFTKKTVNKIIRDFSNSSFGIVSGDNFLDFLNKKFRGKNIEDVNIPINIVATDFQNGDRVNIQKGLLAEAIRASCGIPIVFQPYWHSREKKWLVDGGLSQNFPVDLALEKYHGNIIIAINVGTYLDENIDFSRKNSSTSRFKNIKPTVERIVRIMMRNQHHKINDERVIFFEPDLKNFSALSLKQEKFRKMFEFGQNFAEKIINQ